MIILIHIILAIVLFFIINWIGEHSYSMGYVQVSLFVRNEEAPALNFLIRVLTPIIYLIISSSILYYWHLDSFVKNIYLVNLYYLCFRLSFSIVVGRQKLLNIYKQFLYWVTILIVSYFTYEKIIKIKSNVLPDFTSIANELWIIILVFIFQLLNKIRLSQSSTIKRKDAYLEGKYKYFKKLYGNTIRTNTSNESLEGLAYAILIYENFNRPKIARIVENILFRITKKPHTLGVMQVYSRTLISDKKSVELGTKKIYDSYLSFKEKYKVNPDNYYGEWNAQDMIISEYNGGESYRSEVSELTTTILDLFYSNRTDTLIPPLQQV